VGEGLAAREKTLAFSRRSAIEVRAPAIATESTPGVETSPPRSESLPASTQRSSALSRRAQHHDGSISVWEFA